MVAKMSKNAAFIKGKLLANSFNSTILMDIARISYSYYMKSIEENGDLNKSLIYASKEKLIEEISK